MNRLKMYPRILFVIILMIFNCNAQDKNYTRVLSRHRRIMNGRLTLIEAHPYLVSIQVYGIKGVRALCGGSLISKDWILTAAHCFKYPITKIIVRSGTEIARSGNGKKRKVSRLIVHECYDDVNFRNDVALLKVSRPISSNWNHQSIPMFEANDVIGNNEHAVVAGYGLSGVDSNGLINDKRLRSATIPIFDQDECIRKYGDGNDYVGRDTICAGYEGATIYKDVCAGDSGGPLIIGERLAGITSTTIQCNSSLREPSTYTRVSSYRDWIDFNMN